MVDYNNVSTGNVVIEDELVRVDQISTGGTVVADHVRVEEISSGGLVICKTISGVESLHSGGTIICENIGDIDYTYDNDRVFATLDGYRLHLEDRRDKTENDAHIQGMNDKIDKLDNLRNRIPFHI